MLDILYKKFIVQFGFPIGFHSDQGQHFESVTIKYIFFIFRGVGKEYHPVSFNGKVYSKPY